MDISHLLLAMLTKKQTEITSETRIKVDAYIHLAENQTFFKLVSENQAIAFKTLNEKEAQLKIFI